MSSPMPVVWPRPEWRVIAAAGLLTYLATLSTAAFAAGQVLQPARPVVLTRLVPEGQVRRYDGELLFLAARELIQGEQARRTVYDGRGPIDAIWVGGSYRRDDESGEWQIGMFAWQAGRGMQTTAAVGRPTEALRTCLCRLGILSCGDVRYPAPGK